MEHSNEGDGRASPNVLPLTSKDRAVEGKRAVTTKRRVNPSDGEKKKRKREERGVDRDVVPG